MLQPLPPPPPLWPLPCSDSRSRGTWQTQYAHSPLAHSPDNPFYERYNLPSSSLSMLRRVVRRETSSRPTSVGSGERSCAVNGIGPSITFYVNGERVECGSLLPNSPRSTVEMEREGRRFQVESQIYYCRVRVFGGGGGGGGGGIGGEGGGRVSYHVTIAEPNPPSLSLPLSLRRRSACDSDCCRRRNGRRAS